MVLLEIFLASLLHWPLLLWLYTAASSCCQGDPLALTLLPFLISCFRPGNRVTKLSGAKCRIEDPKCSPVNDLGSWLFWFQL